jgi:glycerophosphoryl diester phosphodiesterase
MGCPPESAANIRGVYSGLHRKKLPQMRKNMQGVFARLLALPPVFRYSKPVGTTGGADMRDNLNITAHAGSENTDDDSFESVERGILSGADIVEVDVRADRRGTLVLSHDEDETREYRGHPELGAALELIARFRSTGINCDIKEPEVILPLLDMAASRGLGPGQLVLTGEVPIRLLEEQPRIHAQASIWLNIEQILEHLGRAGHEAVRPWQDLILAENTEIEDVLKTMTVHSDSLADALCAACRGLRVRVINMPWLEITAALIPRMREQETGASVWTVNDEDSLRRLFGLGAVNVTTRVPLLAASLRKGFAC